MKKTTEAAWVGAVELRRAACSEGLSEPPLLELPYALLGQSWALILPEFGCFSSVVTVTPDQNSDTAMEKPLRFIVWPE